MLVLFIIWKERNRRHFRNKTEQLSSLLENVKLQAYWWLKSYFALFDFEYTRCCLKVPSCVLARASYTSFGPRHLINGVMKPLLYKVPSTKVKEQALRFSFVIS